LFYNNKRTEPKKIARTKLFSVLRPETLLSDPKRSENIKTIKINLGFSESDFAQLVQPLLNEVAIGCQLLPSTEHRFYAALGGLLDFAIYRAHAAMLIFRQSILPPDTHDLSTEQTLWAYVLVTASLLRGLGIICTDYKVDCYHNNGFYTGLWQPLWERFLDRSTCYTFDFHSEDTENLKAYITPFLARLWMPATGFNLIAANPEMFLNWLKLLQEENDGLNILQAILERAEAIAWQYFAKIACAGLPAGFNPDYNRLSSFSQPSDNQISLDLIGVQFLLWLKENLARGNLALNENHLKFTTEGLSIDAEIFKLFCQQNSQFKNWRLIQQGVISLNLHDKDLLNKDVVLLTKAGLILPKEVIVKQGNNLHKLKIQALALNVDNNWKKVAQEKHLNLDILTKRLSAKGKFEQLSESLKNQFKYE